jgi:hypothetical protein
VCMEVGESICTSILDFYTLNPKSRIPLSYYKSLDGIKLDIKAKKRYKAEKPPQSPKILPKQIKPTKKVLQINQVQLPLSLNSCAPKKDKFQSSVKIGDRLNKFKEKESCSYSPNRNARNSSIGAYTSQQKRAIKPFY